MLNSTPPPQLAVPRSTRFVSAAGFGLGVWVAEFFRHASPRSRSPAAHPPSLIAPAIDSSASQHAPRFSAFLSRKAPTPGLLAFLTPLLLLLPSANGQLRGQAMPDPFTAIQERLVAEIRPLEHLRQDFAQHHNAGMLRSVYFEAIGANELAAMFATQAVGHAAFVETQRTLQAGSTGPIRMVTLMRKMGEPLMVANADLHGTYSARLPASAVEGAAQSGRMLRLMLSQDARPLGPAAELVATTLSAQDTPELARQRQLALARIAIEEARRGPVQTLQARFEQLLPAAQRAGPIASFLTLTALAGAYADAQGKLQNDPSAQTALQIKAHQALEQAAIHSAPLAAIAGPGVPELLAFYRLRGHFMRLRDAPSLLAEKHFQAEQAWLTQLLGADSPAQRLSVLNYCNLAPDSRDPSLAERTFAACERLEKLLAHSDLRAFRADDSVSVLLGKGMARAGQKRYGDAIGYYDLAAKTARGNQASSASSDRIKMLALVQTNLGWAQYLAGDAVLAQATLRRAIELMPVGAARDPAPHVSLGDIACAQGDARSAQQHFDQAELIVRELRGSVLLVSERKANLSRAPAVCFSG